MKSMKKSLALAATALAAALALAGCGGTDRATSTGPTPSPGAAQSFNNADVTFAQGMIPHHRQAVAMAKLAADRAANPEVKKLAGGIEKAQGPEIDTMTGWLQAWGRPVPQDTTGTGHGDMGHGAMTMPGMMSAEDMRGLQGASGAHFDRMFLQMMIKHHEGAIEMARTEQANGRYADAIALAKQIETAQTAEIAVMKGLLGS
jgi:uncharacterized protein (DUF305 family)